MIRMEEFKKWEIKSVEPGGCLDLGKGKVVVIGGSRFLRGRWVLLPNKPESRREKGIKGRKMIQV